MKYTFLSHFYCLWHMALIVRFGPNFVIGNFIGCFTVFSLLALAMIIKTVFTISLANTVKYFGNTDTSDAYGIVTSEKFRKGASNYSNIF